MPRDAVREPFHPPVCGVPAHDSRVLEVADEHVAAGTQSQSEAEAPRRADYFEPGARRVDPIDLAQLATAPHAAVGVDGDALGMVEARLGRRAVVEHRQAGRVRRGTAASLLPPPSASPGPPWRPPPAKRASSGFLRSPSRGPPQAEQVANTTPARSSGATGSGKEPVRWVASTSGRG